MYRTKNINIDIDIETISISKADIDVKYQIYSKYQINQQISNLRINIDAQSQIADKLIVL
jgi:hypothetical protein